MRLLIILITVFFIIHAKAQNFRDIIVDENDNGKVFLDFITEIENEYQVDIVCDERRMRALSVSGITERKRLPDYLSDYLVNYKIIKVRDNILFIVDRQTADKNGYTKDNCLALKQSDQSDIILSGKVIDGRTDEPLIGAKIFFPTLQRGMLTDTEGNFSFDNIRPGVLPIEIQYIGYESSNYLVGFSRYGTDQKISTTLFPASKELQSVTITDERIDANVVTPITGVEKLGIETIKTLPAFLGEVDPIRSLTTLPGVSTAGELASGFNVRGGDAGQNLVLQDGAIIYNPSHLFGFFSAFNPDMVNNVSLYKGGGPANFGSRISSVLDVSLRNGDAGKHTVTGGVGLISSRLAVEGPIAKNKSSYLVGGRISYCNWLVNATDNIQLQNSGAQFYDLTAKVFHTINENNLVTFSMYHSYDDFKLATDSVFSWSTMNFALKWDHTFSEKMYSTLSLSNSSYSSEVLSKNEIDPFTYANAIRATTLKYDVSRNISEGTTMLAGIELIKTELEPGKLTPEPEAYNVQFQDMTDQQMLEASAYLQSDFKLSDTWSVAAGLRFSNFFRLGPDKVYGYDYENLVGRYPAVMDSVGYSRHQVVKYYSGLEPRLSLRYLLTEEASFKASYYRSYQYLHLISNTTSTTPQDYWVGSGPVLKPEIGDQFSLGYFRNLKNNLYEFSVEGFYKKIKNVVDYIEGADITLNPALESGLSQGIGTAYGVELFIKKTSGRLSGWIAYTYSRSLRKFTNESSQIAINNGVSYPSAYDQPNNVSLVTNYQVSSRVSLSANFKYSTGRPITIPISKFSYDAYLSVLNYSQRNEYRIPDYHRLDLSMTIKDKPRKNKKFKGEFVLSVFNVYSRNNAYSISFNRYGTAHKLAILGSVFPSLTYNFKF